ncbi:hypothetical protein NDA14_007508 [Ustilago hordei]|nr:hypothetical protein NDA14_007508 [Ustilago hordei]
MFWLTSSPIVVSPKSPPIFLGLTISVLLGSFTQSSAASLATPAFARLLSCSPHATALLLHGLSASSHHQYDPIGEEYQTFCLQHFGPNQPALPTTDLHLIKWMVDLGHQGQSYHAICHHLAALSSWHVDLSLDSSAFSNPHTQHALKGFKRLYGITLHGQKLPITLPILQGLLDTLRVSVRGLAPETQCHGPGCSRSRRVMGSYGRSTGIEDLVEISREQGRSAVSMETMDSYGLICKGGPSTATRRTKLKEQAQPRRGPSSRSMQMVTTQGLERQEPKELSLIKGEGAVSKESTPGHEEEEQCRRS